MRRAGFTLVEVSVALVVGVVAVGTAHAVLSSTHDMVVRLAVADEASRREYNGYRWLAERLRAADVGVDSGRFDGSSDALSFPTWVAEEHGWSYPVRVSIRLDGGRLGVRLDSDNLIVLRDSVAEVHFDYLQQYGADEPWVEEWSSDVRPPAGLRIRLTDARAQGQVDTLLFSTGGRHAR